VVLVLWLYSNNGGVLDTEQRGFIDIMTPVKEFQFPSAVVQYLSNIGISFKAARCYNVLA
jgi:hypothetical protein